MSLLEAAKLFEKAEIFSASGVAPIAIELQLADLGFHGIRNMADLKVHIFGQCFEVRGLGFLKDFVANEDNGNNLEFLWKGCGEFDGGHRLGACVLRVPAHVEESQVQF